MSKKSYQLTNRRKFLISSAIGIAYLNIQATGFLKLTSKSNNMKELRLILTVDNLDEIIDFYKNQVGLKESLSWDEPTGKGIILEAGKASLELIDRKHKNFIDQMEVGREGVSGDVRIALNFGVEMPEKSNQLLKNGAKQIGKLTQAPWSKIMRIEDPAGMQISLFEKSTVTDF